MTKYSLHVGQNKVRRVLSDGSIWTGDLNACENDAAGLEQIALRNGCQARALITGSNPTPVTTVKEFRLLMHQLTVLAAPGDLVFITQSSHGGSDAFGQSLCFWDADVFEEEIRSMLSCFAEGVKVLFVVDSCHSGGLSKDSVLFPLRLKPKFVPSSVTVRDRDRGFFGEPEIKASVAVMAAALSDQVAYDGSEFGMWTGSLIYAFRPDITVVDWFNAAKQLCNPRQTPNLCLLGKSNEWINEPLF